MGRFRPEEIRILLTNADGFADNDEPAIVILTIARQDIEPRNLASALERLHVLTDSRENVIRYRESVLFQVEGYDADPRELQEIPEVRDYFRALTAEWPHWIWFLHRGIGAVALRIALLCEVSVLRGPDNQRATAFKSMEEIRDVMLDLLSRGLVLFDTYDINRNELDDSAMSVIVELNITDDQTG